ncbi:MAG: TetR/AcrR family transcriptional regulator, partial [Solirubrobacterales bacterium]
MSARGPDAARARPAVSARGPGPDIARARPARAVAAAGGRPPSRHLPQPGGRTAPHNGFLEVQRARIVSTLTQAVAELGWAQLSITRIVSRAGVSRRTFYDLFTDREDAFLAAFDDAVAR